MTTHQAHFVEHPRSVRTPELRTTTRCEVPFDGTSSYRNDFVRHAAPERAKRPQPSTWRKMPGNVGWSTYTADYYERPLAPRIPAPPVEPHTTIPLKAKT